MQKKVKTILDSDNERLSVYYTEIHGKKPRGSIIMNYKRLILIILLYQILSFLSGNRIVMIFLNTNLYH